MINKKNWLGRTPEEINVKDAVHVAIVSLVAGEPLKRGEWIKLNEFGHAIRCNKKECFGIVNPFGDNVITGDVFWGLLNPTELDTVRHVWDHPTIVFNANLTKIKTNKYLNKCAEILGITYSELMNALNRKMTGKNTIYNGPLNKTEFEDVWGIKIEYWELWYQWAFENSYEFKNTGTECCPEYDYPNCPFTFSEKATLNTSESNHFPKTALEARDE